MTDPIADLLTRIRNGLQARHQVVTMPSSKIKEAIVKLLKENGFVSHYVLEEMKPQNELKIFLKYDQDRKPAIRALTRVSRPGGRMYAGYKDVKPYLKGLGIRILSTPKGILTDKQARHTKVGGEILCEIW